MTNIDRQRDKTMEIRGKARSRNAQHGGNHARLVSYPTAENELDRTPAIGKPDRQPAPKQPSYKARRVGAALTGLGLVAGVAVIAGVSPQHTDKQPILPTIKEYQANPGKYPGYEEITIQSNDSPQSIARVRLPSIGVEVGGDAILAEDKANQKDGFGQPGFNNREALIVPTTESQSSQADQSH